MTDPTPDDELLDDVTEDAEPTTPGPSPYADPEFNPDAPQDVDPDA